MPPKEVRTNFKTRSKLGGSRIFHPTYPRVTNMSHQSNRTSRRRFLTQSGALAATAFALPYLVPGSAFGANEKIHTGHIGVGRQGMGNLKAFLPHAIAVCDVDQKHAAAAQKLVAAKNGKCEVFGDFRKLLEMPGIDAVVISTPEHWHALPTIAACEAKKDVYCEKPLTLFVAEGRKMVEAARRNNCIVQTGSQQRSDDRFRLACELVRSGRLGKIEKVEVGIRRRQRSRPAGPRYRSAQGIGLRFLGRPVALSAVQRKARALQLPLLVELSPAGKSPTGAPIISISRNGRSMPMLPARWRSKPRSSTAIATKCSPGAS